MPLTITPLTDKHHRELALAVERASTQWVPNLTDPAQIVAALDRVLLFLRQNGSASPQARQVASLAFVFGAQVVATSDWTWHSVSEDDGLNPSLVSADRKHAVLVVDLATQLVMGLAKGSLADLHRACVEHRDHPNLTALE